MLRIHPSASVAAARNYFDSELTRSGLTRSDYYDQGHEPGTWFGKGSEMVGLKGEVKKEDFHALCENRRPDNGEKLNPRNNNFRRPGYDFTFNAPKSVSLVARVVKDERVVKVFQQAVLGTLKYIEQEIHVRVRKDGVVDTRKTGNIVGSLFTHHEARPVDGLTCPHLHCHAYLHNTSFDDVEQKWKAVDWYPSVREAVFYESSFHLFLAEGLQKLGYQIENRPFSFEIAGVGEQNIRRFSRRAKEIEELAHKLGISGDSKAMSKLAAFSRKKKKPIHSSVDKFAEWRSRLDWSEIDLEQTQRAQPKISPKQAVDLAIEHIFERKSVIQGRRILAQAMQNSLGDCGFQEVVEEVKSREELLFKSINGVSYATTRAILQEEREILGFLERTKHTQIPMLAWYRAEAGNLDQQQREAVEAIMHSRDRVIAISGRAGSGKTTLMSTAVAAMEEVGMQVSVFAPTSAAAHQVLKDEGFKNSETVQQLLVNPVLQEQMEGKVLWVDEAGLLSAQEFGKLLKIVDLRNCRLVLSGDYSQHKSVNRPGVFRLICESGHVTVKETSSVYRQRISAYKKAVTALSVGDAEQALEILDDMEAIKEIPDFESRLKTAAREYVESLDQCKTVLVVSPTHLEGRLLTHEIREQMRERGKLDTHEVNIPSYRSRNLTEGQQKLAPFFRTGDVVRFHRKVSDEFVRGELARIVDKNEEGVFVQKMGETKIQRLDFDTAEYFSVFEESVIGIAVGDLVRVSRNAMSLAEKKLFNGNIHRITAIGDDGTITLDDKHQIQKESGLLQWGYSATSHGSQGKTVDKVIISQSGLSFDAASLEQLYVSVSRARDAITIYTSSKEELLESVRDPTHRMLATELEARATAEEEEMQSELTVDAEMVEELTV